MSRNNRLRSKKRAETTANTFIYIILIFISIVWLIPFIYLIFQAFRDESTGMVNYVFPRRWSLINFVELFTKTEFLQWFLNTFLIALVVAVFQTVIVLMVSYTLSRDRKSVV